MRTLPRLSLVLFDFDGVLAGYAHPARVTALAQAIDRTPAQVHAALVGSGLERAYDSGRLDTRAYLAHLGDALDCTVDAAAWIEARIAGSRMDPAVQALVETVATRVPVGVLSNAGPLLAEAMRGIAAPLFPMLDDRVLCSGALGARKPDRAIFEHALAHFRSDPRETLFLDDLFVHVRGARAVGLHAETVRDARSMRKVLRRYGLA